jgi:eukaryotic-like serine/threonine-protein kinase
MPDPAAASISPNGRWVAFSGRDGSATALFVRPIATEVPKVLPGTEGAGRLFWSADSQWIAFYANGKLRKVQPEGGSIQSICETTDLLGGSWNSEGVILFATGKGLHRVLAAGGEPSLLDTAKGTAPQIRREPYFLPDGRHYLYLSGAADGSDAAIWAGSLDSADATHLVSTRSNPAYAEGHLLYHRDGTLFAQRFNPSGLKLSGEAIRVADRIAYTDTGAGSFAASQTGILLYRNAPQFQPASGGIASAIPDVPLLWLQRSVKTEQAGGPAPWAGVDLSPDGRRIAVHRHDPDGGDIWIFDERNSTPTRFTFDATQDNSMPIWSPDAGRIAFGSRRNGKWAVYVKRSDNTRAEELVFESERPAMPMSWSGDRLVYWTTGPTTSGDIWSVSLGAGTGEKKPEPVLQTSADERNPQVSPDGKWIAYSSNETGRSEIYIRPFPQGPGKWQVSVNGGVFPRWRRNGTQLYFLNLVSLGAMMSADIMVMGASIQRDVPVMRFQSVFMSAPHGAGQYHAYAVSPDGDRFLIPQHESVAAGFGGRGRNPSAAAVAAALPSVIADRHGTIESASAIPITVVLDWTAALKK